MARLRPAELILAVALAAASIPAHAATDKVEMLPDRFLTCSIGHSTNFDPTKIQKPEDLKFDSFHVFKLFLPSIPVNKGKIPDPIEEAPAPDPRTRIIADPDHISAQPTTQFGRIIDLWPERVELSAYIKPPLLNAIAITPIDVEHGTASLLMLRASELTHYEMDHFYQGNCTILTGEAARAAERSGG